MHETPTDDRENSEDEYPHWRTALFGDQEHAANLWCGMKYVAWHFFHLLYVLLLGLFIAVAVPAFVAWRLLVYVAVRVGGALAAVLPDGAGEAQVQRVARTTETVRDTPVTRRVYGYCPVDIKMNPKWFGGLGARLEAAYQWAQPPEYRWVCSEDCHSFARHREPDSDCVYCGSAYEQRPVSEIEDSRL